MNKTLIATLMSVTAASLSAQALARDTINIVGSSTVFPFSTAVAETFGRGGKFKTPKVESTGTGGGIKLFCAGTGVQHPDIANASRAMKATEFDTCEANGVKGITEVKIGFDGIVIAESKSGLDMDLTLKDLVHRPGQGRARCFWQAGAQPEQDLEGREPQAAERQDRGTRTPAHLRHAGRLRRTGHGGGLQRLP